MPLRMRYRQNSKGHAFLRELGCKCLYCRSGAAKAQTSGSLVISEDGGAIKFHLLFDCGLGVVDSLIRGGIDKVTHVFISHNHADHILELDRLFNGYTRSLTWTEQQTRLPCYCTAETRRLGPDMRFPYLDWDRIDVMPGQPVVPCEFLGPTELDDHGPLQYGNPGLGVNIQVTPIKVYHGNEKVVPSPVIWVVEFGKGNDRKKIVLGWDLLHLVPRYDGEDKDELYKGPKSQSQTILPGHKILSKADLLILECNTVEPHPETGHHSIDAALRFTIPFLQPRGETWIVHYSGHEDSFKPLSPDGLKKKIAELRKRHRVNRKSRIEVPSEGQWWP